MPLSLSCFLTWSTGSNLSRHNIIGNILPNFTDQWYEGILLKQKRFAVLAPGEPKSWTSTTPMAAAAKMTTKATMTSKVFKMTCQKYQTKNVFCKV